mgnify:CR=1 FL=1
MCSSDLYTMADWYLMIVKSWENEIIDLIIKGMNNNDNHYSAETSKPSEAEKTEENEEVPVYSDTGSETKRLTAISGIVTIEGQNCLQVTDGDKTIRMILSEDSMKDPEMERFKNVLSKRVEEGKSLPFTATCKEESGALYFKSFPKRA